MVVVKSLLIERVPGFVHHGVEARKRVLLIKSRGESRVPGPQSGRERVSGSVHASGFEIKAHVGGNRLAKHLLGLNRKPKVRWHGGFRGPLLSFRDGLKQRHQSLLHPGEQRIVIADGHADFVLIQQDIVGRGHDAKPLDFFACECDESFKGGFERSEIRCRSGFLPSDQRFRAGLSKSFNEGFGQFHRLVVHSSHLADVGSLVVIQLIRFEVEKQGTHSLIGELLMALTGQPGHHFSTGLSAL